MQNECFVDGVGSFMPFEVLFVGDYLFDQRGNYELS